MAGEIYLGRILGIPFRLHWSWFLAVALIAYSVPQNFFPEFPIDSVPYWVLGLLAAVGLFGSVLLHELGHAVVARRLGIGVRGIRLFIFGGVAEIEGEPRKPGHEVLVALGGPLVTVGLIILFGVFWVGLTVVGLPAGREAAANVGESVGPALVIAQLFMYLTMANAVLVVFNLIPAFPLDGGRVFRAFLWYVTGSYLSGTRIAGMVGIAFAWLLIIMGGVGFLTGYPQGFWSVFLGLFLYNAAQASIAYAHLQHMLAGVRVADMMRAQPVVLPAEATLQDALEKYFLRYPYKAYPVVRHGSVIGMLTMRALQEAERAGWDQRLVGDLFNGQPPLLLQPGESILSALQKMSSSGFSRLPVVEGGRLVGLLSRRDIMDSLEIRAGLSATRYGLTPPDRGTDAGKDTTPGRGPDEGVF